MRQSKKFDIKKIDDKNKFANFIIQASLIDTFSFAEPRLLTEYFSEKLNYTHDKMFNVIYNAISDVDCYMLDMPAFNQKITKKICDVL